MRRFYVLIIALMLGLAAYAQTAEDRWVALALVRKSEV